MKKLTVLLILVILFGVLLGLVAVRRIWRDIFRTQINSESTSITQSATSSMEDTSFTSSSTQRSTETTYTSTTSSTEFSFWDLFGGEKNKDPRFGVNTIPEGFEEDISSSGVGWVSMSPLAIWDSIEPEEGEFHWMWLDNQIKRIENLGLEPTIVLMPTSNWATPEAFQAREEGSLGVCDLPEDIDSWRTFLRKMVERYDGDGENDMPQLKTPVLNWHLLEEWPTFWHDRGDSDPENPRNAERYILLLQVTYEVIKEEIPDSRVILTGFASNLLRLAAFADGYIDDADGGVVNGKRLKRGVVRLLPKVRQFKADVEYILSNGAKYFDVIDIHLQDPKICIMEGKIKWIFDLMEKYGITKPVWSIESGGPFKRLAGDTSSRAGDPLFGEFTFKENAEFVVKMHILAFSSGLERFQWSWKSKEDAYWDGPFLLMPLRDVNGNPKPAYYTYIMLQYFMNSFREVSEVMNTDGVRVFQILQKNGKKVFVTWHDDGGKVSVDLSHIIPWSRIEVFEVITELQSNYEPILHYYGPEDSTYPIEICETPLFIVEAEA